MAEVQTGYPYKVGDRVMVGISTWQHPLYPHAGRDTSGMAMDERWEEINRFADIERKAPIQGPRGPYCRYFKAATVVANDREAGILVIDSDTPYAGGQTLDVLKFDEFDGDEVVAYDESLPQDAADAHHRALLGEIH